MELARHAQVRVALAADRTQAVAVNTLLGLASLNESKRRPDQDDDAATRSGQHRVCETRDEGASGNAEADAGANTEASTEAKTEQVLGRGGEDDREEALSTYDYSGAAAERSFAFPGELATFYVIVEAAEGGENASAGQSIEDTEDLKRMCRSLDIVLSVSDESCHPSAVLLCPNQPSRIGANASVSTEDSEGGIGPEEELALVKRLRRTYAVYYFQIDMPTTSSGGSAGSTFQGSELQLALYCRHTSTSFQARLSREAGRVSLATLKHADPAQFVGILPRAQRVLESHGLVRPLERQTLEVKHTVRKERCVAIRSRYKQVNSKCFIEVSCENTHPRVHVVLKDLTLHTFTSRPISMQVTRLGRWVLPLELRPGERQTVCFLLSHFEDISPRAYVEPQEADSEGIGSRYTSIATVTWTSDVSLAEVRGRHRVEWDFASGVFDPVSLRLERDEGCLDLRPGDSFQLLLVVRNRAHADVDLRVILPLAEDMTGMTVIPLDASLHIGKVAARPVEIPLRFMALRAGTADLAQLVKVYDAAAEAIIPVKEPHFVSIS
ncbi:Hypothetical Protein FCC1311_056982 [Hondaea fermentalgiana]|uniref:Uncharacterized protein n=1 Tax=Hondaea fermentalgiana TaxID=2315210 RepID=A0A2R5GEZ3_9STRA|nr:Hypothetical Protein FCC1311_056982 [Hondaea fermentalgiana]|eukprot:GBG29477.1 Hypothetical Protein FCC1311_056982 [Hondaea fermentalgiana]